MSHTYCGHRYAIVTDIELSVFAYRSVTHPIGHRPIRHPQEEIPVVSIVQIETLRIEQHPNLLFVEVRTDDGIVGTGETFMGAAAAEEHIHASFAPRVLGSGLDGVEPLVRSLEAYVGYVGSGVETRARSALDIALWDIEAQRLGWPLHRALGGSARASIRTYNTCAGPHYLRQSHHQAAVSNWGLDDRRGRHEDLDAFMNDAGALAVDLLESGITGMKIWPFDSFAEATNGQFISSAELQKGLDPIRRIRSAVGHDIDVMIELHGLWNLPVAARIADALEEFSPAWIEDPIRPDDVSALASLVNSTSIPVTVGETIAGHRHFRNLIAQGGVDIVSFDVAWCGGITEARRIAHLADAWSLPVAPHDCLGPVVLTAATHLSMHLHNALSQESVRAYHCGWYQDLVTELPLIDRGMIRPPEGAGLGTRLQPDLRTRPGVSTRTSVA